MLKTKLFIFKEIIFIVLGHVSCLLLLDLPVDINSERIVCCAVGWAVSCAQEVSKGAFFLLVELNILVYLVMLHGEIISFEWGCKRL